MKKLIITSIFIILAGCVTSHKLGLIDIGMTKKEVVNILGRPTSISSQKDTEFLRYNLYNTNDDAFRGFSTEYYVRIINGKVESFGRMGDFDSTQKSTIKIETNENIKIIK